MAPRPECSGTGDRNASGMGGRIDRYIQLKTLFEGKLTKTKRDARIVQAVHRYGYSQREVADFLHLHYATVSRLANRH